MQPKFLTKLLSTPQSKKILTQKTINVLTKKSLPSKYEIRFPNAELIPKDPSKTKKQTRITVIKINPNQTRRIKTPPKSQLIPNSIKTQKEK